MQIKKCGCIRFNRSKILYSNCFFLLCFFTQALLLRSFTHIIPHIYIMQFVEERCGISFLCHLTSDFNLADNKTDKT